MRRRVIPSQRSQKKRGATGVSGLPVLSDAKGVREAWLKVLKRKRRELESLSKAINHYEMQDVPQYAAWVESTFSAQLERIRKSVAEVSRLQEFLDQVEWLKTYLGFSVLKAMQVIEAGSFWTLHKDFTARSREDADEDDLFSDAEGEGFHDDDGFDEDPWLPPKPLQRNDSSKVKSLYRELALLLHPDVAPANEQRRYAALWHQLQAAYELGDIELMVEIRQAVGGTATVQSIFSVISIGELIAQVEQLDARLTNLKRDVRERKRLPSWNFVSASKKEQHLKRLYNAMSRDLKDQTIEIQIIWSHLNERVEKLKRKKKAKATKRARGPRASRRSSSDASSW